LVPRSLRRRAFVLVAACAAAALPVQAAAAQQEQCKCPPGVGGAPPAPAAPADGTPPNGSEAERRRRSRRIPLLAPLGILGLLTGAAADIPRAPVPAGAMASTGAPPAGLAPTSEAAAPALAVVAAPVPAGDVQRMQSAFRGKTDSLARGMRAPDTATLLPTLMAFGAMLVAAGVALMRRPRA
jgi:hypothetical protein